MFDRCIYCLYGELTTCTRKHLCNKVLKNNFGFNYARINYHINLFVCDCVLFGVIKSSERELF